MSGSRYIMGSNMINALKKRRQSAPNPSFEDFQKLELLKSPDKRDRTVSSPTQRDRTISSPPHSSFRPITDTQSTPSFCPITDSDTGQSTNDLSPPKSLQFKQAVGRTAVTSEPTKGAVSPKPRIPLSHVLVMRLTNIETQLSILVTKMDSLTLSRRRSRPTFTPRRFKRPLHHKLLHKKLCNVERQVSLVNRQISHCKASQRSIYTSLDSILTRLGLMSLKVWFFPLFPCKTLFSWPCVAIIVCPAEHQW